MDSYEDLIEKFKNDLLLSLSKIVVSGDKNNIFSFILKHKKEISKFNSRIIEITGSIVSHLMENYGIDIIKFKKVRFFSIDLRDDSELRDLLWKFYLEMANLLAELIEPSIYKNRKYRVLFKSLHIYYESLTSTAIEKLQRSYAFFI